MAKGGGKGGAASESRSFDETTRNFLDFQRPLIDQVYGAVTPERLGVPESAEDLLFEALRGASRSISGGDPASQRINSLEDLVNDQMRRAPYNQAIDIFKGFLDRGDGQNANPAVGLFERELEGFTPNEALALFRGELGRDASARGAELLLPTAQGDFLFANPYADRLVDNVTADIARAFERSVLPGITSSFGLAGRTRNSLLADALAEAGRQLASETGRAASNLRGQLYESERGRQLSAAGQVGQLDAQEAARRLQAITGIGEGVNADRAYRTNLISGIGNLSNADIANRLAAAQGVLAAVQADEARRANLLGARAGVVGQAANQFNAGLAAAPGLAAGYTSLPFLPLDNFFRFAAAPLGSSGSGNVDTTSTKSPLDELGGFFETALSAAKLFGLAV